MKWVAAILSAAVLAVGLLAASPRAHGEVHHDFDAPDHACAITLAASGFCDTAAPLVLVVRSEVSLRSVAAAVSGFRWSAPEHWHAPAQAPPLVRA